MLLDTGLRLSELTSIGLQDIDTESGWIRVTGKGAKERVVRIGQVSQKALWRYLVHWPENGRQAIPGEKDMNLHQASLQRYFRNHPSYENGTQDVKMSNDEG